MNSLKDSYWGFWKNFLTNFVINFEINPWRFLRELLQEFYLYGRSAREYSLKLAKRSLKVINE